MELTKAQLESFDAIVTRSRKAIKASEKTAVTKSAFKVVQDAYDTLEAVQKYLKQEHTKKGTQ